MSETNSARSDDRQSAELLKAMQAAFGDSAADWLDADEESFAFDGDAESADFGEFAPHDVDNSCEAESSEVSFELESLLDRLSSAVDLEGTSGHGGRGLGVDEHRDSEEQQTAGLRHVVFEVGDQLFGLPLPGVREIDRCGKVTALPRTPFWLRGVTNLRGQILSVTDFRQLLNLTDERRSVGEKIIVVHSERHDASTALVVDRVLGIQNLTSVPGSLVGLPDRISEFAVGISVADQTTTVLIDPDQLLGSRDLKSISCT